jgi:hypothetical protein
VPLGEAQLTRPLAPRPIVTPHDTETLSHCLNPRLSPNARTNRVTEVQNQNSVKRLKIQTPAIVVLVAQSMNFGNFMKLMLALIPKDHFILMT